MQLPEKYKENFDVSRDSVMDSHTSNEQIHVHLAYLFLNMIRSAIICE
jgi:hypothetical protein